MCDVVTPGLPGAPEEGRPGHRNPRWASVREAGKGLSLGRVGGSGSLCSLLPNRPGSPSRTQGLGSCQAQALPPSLSHCHLSAGPGDQAVGISFLPGDPDSRSPMTGMPGHPEHPWGSFSPVFIAEPRVERNGLACQDGLGIQDSVDMITPRLCRTLSSLVAL